MWLAGSKLVEGKEGLTFNLMDRIAFFLLLALIIYVAVGGAPNG